MSILSESEIPNYLFSMKQWFMSTLLNVCVHFMLFYLKVINHLFKYEMNTF